MAREHRREVYADPAEGAYVMQVVPEARETFRKAWAEYMAAGESLSRSGPNDAARAR